MRLVSDSKGLREDGKAEISPDAPRKLTAYSSLSFLGVTSTDHPLPQHTDSEAPLAYPLGDPGSRGTPEKQEVGT